MLYRRKFKAADGTVRQCATWTIKLYRDGKAISIATKTEKKTEAVAMLKRLEGDVAHGKPVTAEAQRLTFDEAIKAVVADYTINRKRTLADLRWRIDRHLLPYFGGRRMKAITTADLRGYIDIRLKAGAKPGTVNRELAAVRRAFILACQDGRLQARPHFPMLAEAEPRAGFFEPDQFEAVRRHLPAHVQPVATFAYYTGWRKSEVVGLLWRQVDLKAGTVRLDPGSTKNGRGRVVDISLFPEVLDVLKAQRARADVLQKRIKSIIPVVFYHQDGKQIGGPIKDFRHSWQAACRRAGCPGRLVHDLRRTAVRDLIRAGVPQSVCMKVTGHVTDAVFRRYDVVSEQDIREAGRKRAEYEAARAVAQ
jgi:integrase